MRAKAKEEAAKEPPKPSEWNYDFGKDL